jgi:hypothetical protein
MAWGDFLSVIAIPVSAWIGYLFGRRGRTMDFRLEIFQKCVASYQNTLHFLGATDNAFLMYNRRLSREDWPEGLDRMIARGASADQSISECRALDVIVKHLFGEETGKQWASTVAELEAWRNEMHQGGYDPEYLGGVDGIAFPKFAESAARDCKLDLWTRVRHILTGEWSNSAGKE